MDESEQFFVSESIAHARSLPLPECVKYLNGFLGALGSDHPVVAHLQPVFESLHDSDQQLDLIQIGQLKLKLNLDGPRRPHRKDGGKP